MDRGPFSGEEGPNSGEDRPISGGKGPISGDDAFSKMFLTSDSTEASTLWSLTKGSVGSEKEPGTSLGALRRKERSIFLIEGESSAPES